MFNLIRVSFSFLLFLGLGLGFGLGIGLGFGIGNLKNIFKIFHRWRCRQSGRSRPLAVCRCSGRDARVQEIEKLDPFLMYSFDTLVASVDTSDCV